MCGSAEPCRIDHDGVAEDAVDDIVVVSQRLVLTVELHGNVLDDVEEIARREEGPEVCPDLDEVKEES